MRTTNREDQWTLRKGDRTYTTTDPAERANMLADGWKLEGYKPSRASVRTKRVEPPAPVQAKNTDK